MRPAALQARLREEQQAFLEANWDHPQITEVRLAAELWKVIEGEQFVITMGNVRRQAPGVFSISGPSRTSMATGRARWARCCAWRSGQR